MSAAGAEFFLRSRFAIRGGTGLGFLTEAAFAEYVRCVLAENHHRILPRLSRLRDLRF